MNTYNNYYKSSLPKQTLRLFGGGSTLKFLGNSQCSCSKVNLNQYLNNWKDFPLVLDP